MGESRALTGLDRLPWLADDGDHPPRVRSRPRSPWLWAIPLAVAVAAIAYWLGANSWTVIPETPFDRVPEASAPATTSVVLPEARPVASEPVVEPLPQPEVEPSAVPAMPVVRAAPKPTKPVARAPSRKPAVAEAKPAPKADPLAPWPVRTVDGSAGRLVRVGTFSSRAEAKKGWWALMRINPALQRLPALVVAAPSSRDNRTYYRLQMGTTSQAHSVVLCQRMREIGQSCVVVPAPASGSTQ